MNLSVNEITKQAAEVVKAEYNLSLNNSSLHTYSQEGWAEFLKKRNISALTHGLFLPASLTAHVDSSSRFFNTTTYHELFGHGLYFEHSESGRKIHNLEVELSLMSSIDNDSTIRESMANSIFDHATLYYEQCEGFALWLEFQLSAKLGFSKEFEEKLDVAVPDTYKTTLDKYLAFSKTYGDFALFAQCGFPKVYDETIIRDLLLKMYPDANFDLAILYGSQLPNSDIDIFVVSDSIESFKTPWIDIYARSRLELLEDIDNHSLPTIIPIMDGQPIIGDTTKFVSEILKAPITPSAISYNLNRSAEQTSIAKEHPVPSREANDAQYFSATAKFNAEQLALGKKILSHRELPVNKWKKRVYQIS